MNYNILTTPNFEKSLKALAKKYRSIKSDYEEFLNSLADDPLQGVEIMQDTRKIPARYVWR